MNNTKSKLELLTFSFLINSFSKLSKNQLNKYFCQRLTIESQVPMFYNILGLEALNNFTYNFFQHMKLFIKNLDKDINEMQLEGLFAQFGEVVSTKIVYDTITWESKGFAFLEMAKKTDAQKAIEALNGKEIRGRELIVQEAEERRR